MAVCSRCGATVAQDDQFCGSCGEYLEWDSDEVPAQTSGPPATSAPVPSPEPEPDAGPRHAAPPMPVPPMAPTPTVPTMPQPMRSRAVPPVPAEPPPVQPGTVPERQRHRPPPTPTAEQAAAAAGIELLGPNQIRCVPCGAANDDTRRFCRRCGADLTPDAGPVAERLPWWKRLFKRDPDKPKKWHPAGHRRSVKRIRILRILAIVAVIALVLTVIAMWPARSYVDSLVNSVKDRFGKHEPVVPSEVRTSSSATGTKADFLLDGIADKYWAPAGDGVGEWVEVDFAGPTRLVDIVVSSGSSRKQEDFLTQARPDKIKLTMTGKDGKETVEEFSLADKAEPQSFDLGVSDVVTVKVEILSSYGFERGKVVAVAELEFFARK